MTAHETKIAKLAELFREKPRYECYSCGEHKHMSSHNERSWQDQGEWIDALFCDECLEKKRDAF